MAAYTFQRFPAKRKQLAKLFIQTTVAYNTNTFAVVYKD